MAPAGIAHSTASHSSKHRALSCSVPPCADGGGRVWRQPGRAGRGEFHRLRALPREVRTGCGGFISSRVSKRGIVDRRLKPLCNIPVACWRIAGFQAALHDLGACSCPLHTIEDDQDHMRAAAALTGAARMRRRLTHLPSPVRRCVLPPHRHAGSHPDWDHARHHLGHQEGGISFSGGWRVYKHRHSTDSLCH